MTPNEDKDVFSFEKFLGLRNTVAVENFEPGDLEVAVNVDVTDAQKIIRRAGYNAPVFGSAAHSFWSDGDIALFMSGGTLYRLNPDDTYTAVRAGLGDERMVYTSVAGRAYYSNGTVTGVVDGYSARSWGLPMVNIQPTATQVGGALPAGRYQYAMTYVRADGQESGCGLASTIDLPTAGGIQFDLIPVPTDLAVVRKHLYVSPVDGDVLYLQMILDPATETATYFNSVPGTVPLATQFLSAPPAGSTLGYFNGHVLVASGSSLYPSQPYAPELFDLRRAVHFGSPITLVAPMDDGVYLGTEGQVIWLAGRSPSDWAHLPKLASGVIPGTLAYTDAADIAEGQSGPACLFATVDGICVGLNGGVVQNLTGSRYRYPIRKFGAAMVRDSRGMTQYVVTLRGASQPANTAE